MAKELAEQSGRELEVMDWGENEGKGLQNVTSDEFRIPFIRILDAKSPQCRPVAQGGTPGAKAGSILLTSTGEVWDGDKGFDFVPVERDHKFIEWIPRNDDGSGGGFVGIHEPQERIVEELRTIHGRFGKLPMDNGNQLAETFSLFGLALHDNDPPVQGIISFASTQIPKYQTFMNRALAIKYPNREGVFKTAPIFAHCWHFNTIYESKGANSWYGWKITLKAKNEDGTEAPARQSLVDQKGPIFAEAVAFNKIISQGKAKVDYGKTREPGDESDDIPM